MLTYQPQFRGSNLNFSSSIIIHCSLAPYSRLNLKASAPYISNPYHCPGKAQHSLAAFYSPGLKQSEIQAHIFSPRKGEKSIHNFKIILCEGIAIERTCRIRPSLPTMAALPPELLVQVAESLPKSSLPAFALASRNFRSYAVPILYRFVEFRIIYDGMKTFELRGLPSSLADAENPEKRSRIWLHEEFLRTISTSAELRSLILGLSYEFRRGYPEDASPSSPSRQISVLGILQPYLQYCHIAVHALSLIHI